MTEPRHRPWWQDDRAPTPPLGEFLTQYEADDNLWWRVGCGHHQNLFDQACEQIEALEAGDAAVRERWEATDAHIAMLDDIRALVTKARQISPSNSMTLYVADLERALGMDVGRPHKLGMSDGEPEETYRDVELHHHHAGAHPRRYPR